jgi:hypothetical protein
MQRQGRFTLERQSELPKVTELCVELNPLWVDDDAALSAQE